MRFLKKYIRKLYHLIWFLGAFVLFSPYVKAETVNMTFSTFRTYASSYGIVSNSEIYSTTTSVPINMSSIAAGAPFEWITSYNMTCTGNTVITGRFRFDGNSNLTYDFLQDNIKEIYYAPNISGVSSTSCSWSVNPNNLQVSFTCTTNQPNSNFIVGGRWRYRTGSFSAQYLVWRNMNITCDNSASAIIENNNQNTQDIINNNNSNTQKEVDAINGLKEEQQETNDNLNDIDDTLNDSSIDSSDTTINGLKNQIPTNSVISDLLLLPIRFLQNFVNALNSSCSTFSLGSLLGTNLFMPCINLENYLGSTIWTMIDLIFSGMFVFGLRKKFIQIYENITNLKNGGNEVD